jgi:hypothetical protein
MNAETNSRCPEDQLKHTLRDDTPRLIRVSVVADDLGCEHERGDE